MCYDQQQGERIVRESERCLFQEQCLLYQFAKRLEPPYKQTFFCPPAESIFRDALPDDSMLDFVLDNLTRLSYCYRIDETGEFADGKVSKNYVPPKSS